MWNLLKLVLNGFIDFAVDMEFEEFHYREKQCKDRVTLLTCVNAAGTCKLPLAFIHKSMKPRCFKHMDMNLLPVHYYAQHKAWMDTNEKFVPYVKRFCEDQGIEYKILLLLDNAPAHPSSEELKSADGNVTTIFLPPNTTSILQPMDQGVIEALKRCYNRNLLRHIFLENETSLLTIPDIIKQLTIKDAVYWSAQAWEETTSSTLMKAWNRLIPCPSTVTAEDEAPSNVTFVQLFDDLGYDKADQNWQSPDNWLAEDSNDPGYQLMTDSEIVADILGKPNNQDSDLSSDDEMNSQPFVTGAEACNAFETALRWLEAQEGTDPFHLLLVKRWRDTAAQKI